MGLTEITRQIDTYVVLQTGTICLEDSTCLDENLPMLSPLQKKSGMSSTTGYVPPAYLPVWREEPEWFYSSLRVGASRKLDVRLEWGAGSLDFGFADSTPSELTGSRTKPVGGESPLFPPEVALHLVKIACEMPDQLGTSISLWDCQELARKLEEDHIVESISAETVRRILNNHHLKPWRYHMWLGAKTPRDEVFCSQVKEICDLYTRTLLPHEMVLCLDEKTSLQPRTRTQATKPAKPGKPVRVEHEYTRKGALNLFAAFDTRTGRVYGRCFRRKRQIELIAFLHYLDHMIPNHITKLYVICDNLSVHKGKKVMRWLSNHPRFSFHFTSVHCSWMNQVEQWFSIFKRKRFKIANFTSIEDLRDKIYLYIEKWNRTAHPFKWTTKSVTKIMAYAAPLKEAA
jgi:transposase